MIDHFTILEPSKWELKSMIPLADAAALKRKIHDNADGAYQYDLECDTGTGGHGDCLDIGAPSYHRQAFPKDREAPFPCCLTAARGHTSSSPLLLTLHRASRPRPLST